MRRRRLLCSLAALPALLSGCLAGLPRASGPRSGPTPDGTPGGTGSVVVADVGVEPTDDDRLRVVVTVTNRGAERTEARAAVTVRVDGEASVRETAVTVPAGGTTTADVEFAVTFDAFSSGGSVSARIA